jgi:hypothetical protein
MKYKSGRKTSSGYKLQAAARYIEEHGAVSAREITQRARSRTGKIIDLTPLQLSMRLKVHPSFESIKLNPDLPKSSVLWKLRDRRIFEHGRWGGDYNDLS